MPRYWLPLLSLALLAPVASARAEDPIAYVVAVEGHAHAALPDEPHRPLACGDPIHEGERLVTEPGARLVVAHDGHHAHLGPDGLLVLRRTPGDETLVVLVRGGVRLLDGNDLPESHVATPAGPLALHGADFEIRRTDASALEICEWSGPSTGACRRIDAAGRILQLVQEGPRIDRGAVDYCTWPRSEPVSLLDFTSPPAVASGPDSPFEPEPDDPGAGCAGDECTNPPVIDPSEIVYTVAPPPIFVPDF